VREYAAFDWIDWFGVILPCIAWLRRYAWRKDLAVNHFSPPCQGSMCNLASCTLI